MGSSDYGGVQMNNEDEMSAQNETLKPTFRWLLESDSFCPKCGHNRDFSSVSSVDAGGGVKCCQQCGATWNECQPADAAIAERGKA